MKNFSRIMAVLLWLIIMFIIIQPLLNSCKTSDVASVDTVYFYKHDTIQVVDNKIRDSLVSVLQKTKDSLKRCRDSIEYEDYINARRIEKVKYYINICEKNSKNKKYFYGWIKRAVSE
jgi:hypothetical protein